MTFISTLLRLAVPGIFLVSIGCASKGSIPDVPPGPEAMFGEYISNPSHLDSVVLHLNPDGSYEGTWYGCMGEMESASGSWALSGDAVELSPVVDGELFFSRPRRLLVVPFKGAYSLANPENVYRERVSDAALYKRQADD